MAQYLDKEVLVEKIEKRKKQNVLTNEGAFEEDVDILCLLYTLDAKEVEEPNASDRGTAEEIIINLKRVEQDYRINLTKEIRVFLFFLNTN